MVLNLPGSRPEDEIYLHWQLLGHEGHGLSELRVFDPVAMVAYADNAEAVTRLALEMDGKAPGVYIGVQPRPLEFFESAPNRWTRARASSCACQADIEYITAVYIDIDVVSAGRADGHPASASELEQTLELARLVSGQDELAGCSTIACTGNGHCIIAPVVPIEVDSEAVGGSFKCFCRWLIDGYRGSICGARPDDVFDLCRVMRLVGTMNLKGRPCPDRPHRRARFVTEPVLERSMALHQVIINTEPSCIVRRQGQLPRLINCDLSKLESCEFIKFCRRYPELVSEPLWFAMVTNLAHLEGGRGLIHEISRLDPCRYDYEVTERLIDRVIERGYRPVKCSRFCDGLPAEAVKGRFHCPRIKSCPARAPMYLAALYAVYGRRR